MDVTTILQLVKDRLGIRSEVRDIYLLAIIEAVIDELQNEKGIALNESSSNHLLFIVDYTTWRYQNRDSTGAMPRHLQFRLHNLVIHSGGGTNV